MKENELNKSSIRKEQVSLEAEAKIQEMFTKEEKRDLVVSAMVNKINSLETLPRKDKDEVFFWYLEFKKLNF
jgi:hypothetical protein